MTQFPQGKLLIFPCNLSNDKSFYQVPIKDYIGVVEDELRKNSYERIYCHSLGSLIFFIHLCERVEALNNTKVFFISPALVSSNLRKAISFLPDSFKIPSLNRPSWRCHPYCLVRHYREILELQSIYQIDDINRFDFVEIVYDPRDELLNVDKFELLSNRREYYSKNFPRHLCLDFIERDLFGL
ncbi:hypothetical protein M901_1620 [Bacteriovorax sp. DB6_IX]|nr:hypothetical protein M901_1620 [Bacteriovorax sp. DB6_IX]